VSQGNVELVRRTYVESPAGLRALRPDEEVALLDRLFRDYLDEQSATRMAPDYPEGEQVLRGREGVARLLAMLRDAWAEFRLSRSASSTPGIKSWC
jgi:hypothetical protein